MTSTPDRGPVLRTATLDAADVVHPVDGLASHDVPGGRVILGTGAEPITLSTSAAAIYDAIDGVRSIVELARPVARHFGVVEAEVEAVVISTVRRFGALGLLANVQRVTGSDGADASVFPSADPPVAQDQPEQADTISSILRLPEENSCVAQRFDLARAKLYSIRTPVFELGIGAAGDQAVDAVESLLGEFLIETPLPLGLMLVAPAREREFVEPVFTIFDGSGYRAWRGRDIEQLRSYLLAMLSPLGATAAYPRCFMDMRSVERDGEVILVHPYVLDDARLMIECRRNGWKPLPRLYTEVNAHSREVVLREPFDPSSPGDLPGFTASLPIVGIHCGVSAHPPEPVYALELLVRRHLALADGLSVEASLPVFAEIASRVPTAVADVPGGLAYLQSFRRLVAQVEGEVP